MKRHSNFLPKTRVEALSDGVIAIGRVLAFADHGDAGGAIASRIERRGRTAVPAAHAASSPCENRERCAPPSIHDARIGGARRHSVWSPSRRGAAA